MGNTRLSGTPEWAIDSQKQRPCAHPQETQEQLSSRLILKPYSLPGELGSTDEALGKLRHGAAQSAAPRLWTSDG